MRLQVDDGRTVRLHSCRVPQDEADRLVAPLFSGGEPGLVVVIGLGLGYVLDAVERQSMRTKVLALEVCPATVVPMRGRRDWSSWTDTGRLTLLVGPDYEGIVSAGRLVKDKMDPLRLLGSAVFAREMPAEVTRAHAAIDRMLGDARSNLEARKNFAPRYLMQTLQNIPAIAREGDVAALDRQFDGLPAVTLPRVM